MEMYNYGDITPEGVWFDALILTDVNSLYNLVNNLKSYNKEIVTMNSRGIIIKHMDDKGTSGFSPIDIRLVDLENKTMHFEGRIDNLEGRIDNLEGRLHDLEYKINFPIPVDEVLGQEITDEFFLFADLLPEHIRKELKIYKK